MYVRKKLGRTPLWLCALAAFLCLGDQCPPEDYFEEGNLLILLCRQDNLQDCHLTGANIQQAPVKWDMQHLPPEIGNDRLRSLMVVCGVPAAALLYEAHHFDGNLGVFHCDPAETLEVPSIGPLAGQVSSMVFTDDDYYVEGIEAIYNLGFDLSAAVGPFRHGVKQGLEADGDVEEIDLWRTRIWWTDWLNVMADPAFDGSDAYSSPHADNWRRHQIAGFYQRVDLDPDWWAFNYEVRLKWFLHPEIQTTVVLPREPPRTDIELTDALSFDPWAWTLWVEGGILTDKIFDGIAGEMWRQAGELNRGLVMAIIARGDPFGEYMVSHLDSLGWTVIDPRPCNPHSALSCTHSQSTPPTVILHHDFSTGRRLATPEPASPVSMRAPRAQMEPLFGPPAGERAPEALAEIEPFARLDASGRQVPFASVAELEQWTRQTIQVPPGHDVLLFEQKIGDKTGLLIVGGPADKIDQIRGYRAEREAVRAAAPPEALEGEALASARSRARKTISRLRGPQAISARQVEKLIEQYRDARGVSGDPELDGEVALLLRDLAARRERGR